MENKYQLFLDYLKNAYGIKEELKLTYLQKQKLKEMENERNNYSRRRCGKNCN